MNAEVARQYTHFALEKVTIPITPHLLFPHIMNDLDAEGRQHALRIKLILLGRCEELWVFGDNLSEGMRQEIQRAKTRNMIVRWFSQNFQEVTR